jgi:putative ATPase
MDHVNRTTTENPSFEVIPALLSRCQVYVLNAFTKKIWSPFATRFKTDSFLASKNIELRETEALLRLSGGGWTIIEYI